MTRTRTREHPGEPFDHAPGNRARAVAGWACAGTVALAVHVAALAWLVRAEPVESPDQPLAAIEIEFAPVPEAVQSDAPNIAADRSVSEASSSDAPSPEAEPESEIPPEPVKAAAEDVPETTEPPKPIEPADPVETATTPPVERAEVPLPAARPKQPRKKTVAVQKPKPRSSASASRRTDKAAAQVPVSARNAASASTSGPGSSMSPAQWQQRLMAHLERRKQYPSGSRSRREAGIGYVRFQIDETGRVLSVSLARSSGFAELDAEVVALVRRASPVPAPPAGTNRTITAPVRFSVR
ncbi:energy transducer TonB family protein [Enterovirga rhinocerotis]|uniref:Protein TonB n=1 Tax=Enterovirga rhinocerotis TaxID=1339210 RepID=A0A4R7BV14_9HYPH|nr:energy transducer TonB [Enterovirga rhinocerotis]TDR88892.1 protein TonB [Enterovirga rhinocerotis]